MMCSRKRRTAADSDDSRWLGLLPRPSEGNAIAAARKPTYDRLLREFPNTLVQTSGPVRRTARWADGQQRSRPPEHRRRPRRPSWT